jgi:hypothetical protein
VVCIGDVAAGVDLVAGFERRIRQRPWSLQTRLQQYRIRQAGSRLRRNLRRRGRAAVLSIRHVLSPRSAISSQDAVDREPVFRKFAERARRVSIAWAIRINRIAAQTGLRFKGHVIRVDA